jgi:hypothetical protein
LFLRVVSSNGIRLPNLIQPQLGEQLADGNQFLRMSELMQQAPELSPERLDQIAALPLGARIVADPWSERLDLLRAAAVPPATTREKVPLTEKNAKRLGIKVVRSVAECLDFLEQVQHRRDHPSFLQRLANAVAPK